MVENMTMFKVNIHEAKARLSEFLEAVERASGSICKRNRPIAELRAIAPARAAGRLWAMRSTGSRCRRSSSSRCPTTCSTASQGIAAGCTCRPTT